MRKFSKKTVALVVSIALLICVGVGSTLAYLMTATDPVVNTFTASQVSTYVTEKNSGETKKNVQIQNTGDIEANIRANIVVTWQNANGEILAQAPVKWNSATNDGDYKIEIGDKWELVNGFYVYEDVVAPDGFTDDLIVTCKPLKAAPADGYYLCVEIIASGIQAEGISGTHPWGI